MAYLHTLSSSLWKESGTCGNSCNNFAFLLFSIYLTQVAPIWAFYSLPTRAWELGFGALLLFLPETNKKIRILPWLGFLGIVFASLNFNENTAFPGKNALVPVLGTVVLIASIRYWPPLFNDLANSRLSQWLVRSPIPCTCGIGQH